MHSIKQYKESKKNKEGKDNNYTQIPKKQSKKKGKSISHII
jgi:hypothetical protein